MDRRRRKTSMLAAPGGSSRLPDGTPYFGRLGEMAYDGEQVQCHLCGRWFKVVGAIHIRAAHGITLDGYREMFHLLGNVTTAAPKTSQRKRQTMLRQIATGERIQPYDREPDKQVAPGQPTVRRFRSLAILRPDLAAEWHPTRNGERDPNRVGQHSKRKVWWRCRDCGHEWQQSPKIRTQGNGCPACGKRRSIAATVERNRRPIPRARSFAVLHSELLAEWHPTRNGELDPYTIARASDCQVWWRCQDCAHEWKAAVSHRTRRRRSRPQGCPTCARRRQAVRQGYVSRDRSFAVLYPQLLAEWHLTRNGELDPYTVGAASTRPVWWRCAECGQEWEATPGSRSRSPRGGCRHCASSHGQRQRWAKARARRTPAGETRSSRGSPRAAPRPNDRQARRLDGFAA